MENVGQDGRRRRRSGRGRSPLEAKLDFRFSSFDGTAGVRQRFAPWAKAYAFMCAIHEQGSSSKPTRLPLNPTQITWILKPWFWRLPLVVFEPCTCVSNKEGSLRKICNAMPQWILGFDVSSIWSGQLSAINWILRKFLAYYVWSF